MTKIFATLISLFLFVSIIPQVYADGCYLCGSGSSNGCQQCRYYGSDSGDQRKKCEKAGCKISGTSSCSTAANVKVCTAKADLKIEEFLARSGK